MSWPLDAPDALASISAHLPALVVGAWVVRVPLLSREEGHEAITRQAWAGLDLADAQEAALISGVRAPDVGLSGLLSSPLPFAQPRHALRRWWGTTTPRAIADLRGFVAEQHRRALQLPDARRRWHTFGRVLHALQDSYSPAHVVRDGGRIVRMKHWGAFDRWRRSSGAGAGADQHGFPTDPRDSAFADGAMTDAAVAATRASRQYLELALTHCALDAGDAAVRQQLSALLDRHLAS